MEARFTSRDPDWLPATSRRWRSVLAGLISLALVLSFFHGWPFDGEDDTAAISIALTVDDFAGKTPADPASLHGDHCLTHVSSVAAQDAGITIGCVAHGYRVVSLRSPEAVDLVSAFKPPRA